MPLPHRHPLEEPVLRLLDGARPPLTAAGHRPGRSFTRQDYLSLAGHPAVRAAAQEALGHYGLTAPGPDPSPPVLALQDRLAACLRLSGTVAFPSGTEAIRHCLRTLLRPGDQLILDSAAHPAMSEAALLAGARVHRSPSASVEAVERRLSRLARSRSGRLVVALPAVSALGARIADLAELSLLTRDHGALLIVDVTHDFGAMGPAGGGIAEIQACLPRIDVLVGSLSKSFGAPGGFAAAKDPALTAAFRQAQGRSSPLAPVNAAAIQAALTLSTSGEGQRRRRNLHGLSLRLRNHLMADGIRPMGQAAPFVPIRLPPLSALPRHALLESAGTRIPLLQAPVVPLHAPRWRILLTADHSPADIDDLAELIRDVSRAFDRQCARTRVPA